MNRTNLHSNNISKRNDVSKLTPSENLKYLLMQKFCLAVISLKIQIHLRLTFHVNLCLVNFGMKASVYLITIEVRNVKTREEWELSDFQIHNILVSYIFLNPRNRLKEHEATRTVQLWRRGTVDAPARRTNKNKDVVNILA